MEWYNSLRLIICTNKIGKAINLNQTNAKTFKQLQNSLQFFHTITEYIHKDIYYKNISQINKTILFLNDFGLADIKNELSPIKGNPFFVSDHVLQCNEIKFRYDVCDDIYSLTFSFIYLKDH
jgi:tRNA A-37 threonylcarbamoyl transferase component Bud32